MVFTKIIRNAAPSFREALRVAVVAAARELAAAGHRVPGGIRPLDCRVVSHGACAGCKLNLPRDDRHYGTQSLNWLHP